VARLFKLRYGCEWWYVGRGGGDVEIKLQAGAGVRPGGRGAVGSGGACGRRTLAGGSGAAGLHIECRRGPESTQLDLWRGACRRGFGAVRVGTQRSFGRLSASLRGTWAEAGNSTQRSPHLVRRSRIVCFRRIPGRLKCPLVSGHSRRDTLAGNY